MPVEIRGAGQSEIPAAAELLFREFPASLPCRVTADRDIIARALREAMPHVIVAVRDDGKIVGVLVLTDQRFWWGTQRYVTDLVMFVSPVARASRIGLGMVKVAKAVAASLGVPLVMGVMNGEDAERKDRFFEKNGFRRLGGFYVTGG